MFSITKKIVPKWVPLVFGIILGVATGLLRYFGVVMFVQSMLPYAFVAILLMFIVTAILKARCGSSDGEGFCISPTCASLRRFTPMIVISAAVFVPFALVVFATNLSLALKTVLAFVGGVSFWVLLLAFVSMIFSVHDKR